jgi:ditrans,polycis-polyprenyl diphosphate synthase
MSTSQHSAHLRNWLLSLPPVEWGVQQLRELLIGSLKCGPIPEHIAFVMDGNRRWARRSKVETVEGHNMGFEALARILEVCYKSGVRVVTVYAFSIENFKRSKYEVDGLMDIAKTKLVQLSQHGDLLDRYGASVRILGDKSLIRKDVQEQIDRAVEMTKHNDSAVLNVCFPYTGREEITHSVRETVREFSTSPPTKPMLKRSVFSESHIQRNIISKRLPILSEESESPREQQSTTTSDADSISEHDLEASSHAGPPSSHTSPSPSPVLKPHHHHHHPRPPATTTTDLPDPELITADTLTRNTYTSDAPPLDLLIRTSGVQRLSDFMLWQVHEDTELKFLDTLWPDFDLWHFLPVLVEWQWRQKKLAAQPRTGGLKTA